MKEHQTAIEKVELRVYPGADALVDVKASILVDAKVYLMVVQ